MDILGEGRRRILPISFGQGSISRPRTSGASAGAFLKKNRKPPAGSHPKGWTPPGEPAPNPPTEGLFSRLRRGASTTPLELQRVVIERAALLLLELLGLPLAQGKPGVRKLRRQGLLTLPGERPDKVRHLRASGRVRVAKEVR